MRSAANTAEAYSHPTKAHRKGYQKMVSFWPWKGEDNSPASFEKALSTLSEKISRNTTKLDSLRQRSRRFGVLWTLYSGFAYLLYSIILVLVVGWKNWGAVEWSAIAGGPVIFYIGRLGLTTYYEYRTSTLQAHVDDLQKQRDVTIKKLKTATKYDSTAELLKKYGGSPTPKARPAGGSDRNNTPKQNLQSPPQGGRTNFAPPPTANIPGRNTSSPLHDTPQRLVSASANQQITPNSPQFSPQQQHHPHDNSAEFAPNAFPSAPQYAPANEGSHWYDRFMDVLLGEDETLPGKRLALICNRCRLVNGQAPPGVKRLEDVGKWRCGGCGAMNGEETDVKRIVAAIKEQDPVETQGTDRRKHDDGESFLPAADGEDESDVTVYTEDEEESGHDEDGEEKEKANSTGAEQNEALRRRSTRPKRNGKKGT